MAARPIVLDCDPGHDDAIAILLAHGCPDVELRAITTVAGNQTIEKTTLNARKVCTVAGITGVPIAAGAGRPLVRHRETAPDIHGESGLDGPALPEPTVGLEEVDGADLIVQLALEAEPGELTLVPTGPLTNVALALERAPHIGPRLREIVLMGGSTDRGNWTPAAEFNIWADPEAADIVFRSGVPVTMCGLNLTHQALATPDVVKRVAAVGTQVADVVVDLLRFFEQAYRDVFGFGSPPVHDPCAVARVARPDLVGVREAFVAVETAGEWTAGMTVVDLHGRLDREPNALVGVDLNVDGFWDLVIDALERIG